jgi:hypothetical protein
MPCQLLRKQISMGSLRQSKNIVPNNLYTGVTNLFSRPTFFKKLFFACRDCSDKILEPFFSQYTKRYTHCNDWLQIVMIHYKKTYFVINDYANKTYTGLDFLYVMITNKQKQKSFWQEKFFLREI